MNPSIGDGFDSLVFSSTDMKNTKGNVSSAIGFHTPRQTKNPPPCPIFIFVTAIFLSLAPSAQSQSYTWTTLAGSPGAFGAADGAGSVARFSAPYRLAVDSTGNVYVGDRFAIRKITPNGVVAPFAGGILDRGTNDGKGIAARFDLIRGIAADANDNLIVSDDNHTIRRITPDGTVTTIAGRAGIAGATDGPGASATFRNPIGVGVDSRGNIFVADSGNYTVRKIDTNGIVSTFAGGVRGNVNGAGTQAQFYSPSDLFVGQSNVVYLAEDIALRIRRITPNGDVTTLVENPPPSHVAPLGICGSPDGNIYVSDFEAHTILKLDTSGIIKTFAGSTYNSASADGADDTARFNNPSDVAADRFGNIYVVDSGNFTIRQRSALTAPTILTQPTNSIVAEGRNAFFSANAIGYPRPTVRWQFSSDGGTNWTSLEDNTSIQGASTTNLSVLSVTQAMNGYRYRFLAANDAGNTISTSASLTITPAQPIIITHPESQAAVVGTQVSLKVVARGTAPLSYQWRFNGTNINGASNAAFTFLVQTNSGGNYGVVVSNAYGSVASSNAFLLVTPVKSSLVPGRIQAEDFDEGGEGVAYHSSANVNTRVYRETTVPIYPTSDIGGGFDIVLQRQYLTQPVDWVKYTLFVLDDGLYSFHIRDNSFGVMELWPFGTLGASFHLEMDDVPLGTPIGLPGAPPVAAKPPYWLTHISAPVRLLKGIHVLRLVVDSAFSTANPSSPMFRINYINAVRTSTPVPDQNFAGSLTPGYTDGTRAEARFSSGISGLAATKDGALLVADAGNLRIRRISPSGQVTTLAGSGASGDADGLGPQASFSDLSARASLTVDSKDNCYVLDYSGGANKVRKITPQGDVTTVFREPLGDRYSFLSVTDSGDFYARRRIDTTSGFSHYQEAHIVNFRENSSSKSVMDFFHSSQSGTGLVAIGSSSVANLVYMTEPYCECYMTELHGLNSATLAQLPAAYMGVGAFAGDWGGRFYLIYPLAGIARWWEDGAFERVYSSALVTYILAVDGQGNVFSAEGGRIVKIPNTEGLTVQSTTKGGGIINVSPGPGPYLSNTVVQVSEFPNPDWMFLGWSGDATGTATNLTFQLTNHVMVQATFGAPLKATTVNGVITRNPELLLYPYGTQVTLSAQPDVGYKFLQWSDGVTTASRIVAVTNLINLQAQLAALPLYALNTIVLGGTGGAISRDPAQAEYFKDTSVTLTAVPNPGYIFQTWFPDGSINNPHTITITSNITLFAVFAASPGDAPRVAVAPKDSTVLVGEPALMSVQPDGFGPFTYQWKLNGTNIASATNSFVVIAHATTNDSGSYSVVVNSAFGSISASANLTVTAVSGVRFTSRPTISAGQLQLNLAGDPGKKYQLETSTNLISWSALVTLDNPFGVFQFTDPLTSSIPRRYYRAVQVP